MVYKIYLLHIKLFIVSIVLKNNYYLKFKKYVYLRNEYLLHIKMYSFTKIYLFKIYLLNIYWVKRALWDRRVIVIPNP